MPIHGGKQMLVNRRACGRRFEAVRDGHRIMGRDQTMSDQTMSDQTMPDQTMPDQTMIFYALSVRILTTLAPQAWRRRLSLFREGVDSLAHLSWPVCEHGDVGSVRGP